MKPRGPEKVLLSEMDALSLNGMLAILKRCKYGAKINFIGWKKSECACGYCAQVALCVILIDFTRFLCYADPRMYNSRCKLDFPLHPFSTKMYWQNAILS